MHAKQDLDCFLVAFSVNLSVQLVAVTLIDTLVVVPDEYCSDCTNK